MNMKTWRILLMRMMRDQADVNSLLKQDKYFRLENIHTPNILVRSIMDYDVVQKISLVLHVQVHTYIYHTTSRGSVVLFDLWPNHRCLLFQDTFNGSTSNMPFFTSVAAITVHVKDVDNRPPWFQPCMRTNLGISKLCVSTGYKGKVNLTEKEVSRPSDTLHGPQLLYGHNSLPYRIELICWKSWRFFILFYFNWSKCHLLLPVIDILTV